ncbi:hypothetical protein DEM26_07855 [Thioclava sp. NG1]|nr:MULTISPECIES: sugar phosphate nucleotidyltransferase [Thioclava]OWY15081.1 hypothetical protein B6V72_00305 [Thioclava sp. F34-6]PWE50799.1 hypothetical protein DEM26_07855 [Thioclava sp. NG1]
MNSVVNPVVLSGGMGTRLWPMSRVAQPKQFQSIDGNGGPTFLQSTVARHLDDDFADPLLVAAASEEGLVRDQLAEIGVTGRFLGEPMGRNTGPAVLAAALTLAEEDPEALLLVLPSDHKIEGDMNTVVKQMREGAQQGRIVLFGVVPKYAETGFGYISGGALVDGQEGLHEVTSFIEKPELEKAQRLVASGDTFWASGISLMRADVLIEEFEKYDPATLAAVLAALDGAKKTETGLCLDGAHFAEAANEPTERLIFERSDRVAVAPVEVDWDDVGAWTAIHSISPKGEDGNVSTGQALTLDCRNSLIRAGDKLVTVIGMEDVIVVDTPDALLVTNHSNAQKVKDAVAELKAQNRSEVARHPEVATEDIGQGGEAFPAVSRLTLDAGETATFRGPTPGGKLLAVSSGRGHWKNGGPTHACSQGHSINVSPGSSVEVWNTGDGALSLYEIDLSEDEAEETSKGTRDARE